MVQNTISLDCSSTVKLCPRFLGSSWVRWYFFPWFVLGSTHYGTGARRGQEEPGRYAQISEKAVFGLSETFSPVLPITYRLGGQKAREGLKNAFFAIFPPLYDARRARRASYPPTPKEEEAVPFLWLQKYNLLGCSDFVPLLSDPHGWRLPLAGIVGLESSPVFTLGGIRLPPAIFVTAERRASALDAAPWMPGGELVLFPTYHPLFTSDFPHLTPPFSLDILHPPRKPGLLFFIVKSLLLTIKREGKRYLSRVLADCGKCGYRVPDARRGASASRV